MGTIAIIVMLLITAASVFTLGMEVFGEGPIFLIRGKTDFKRGFFRLISTVLIAGGVVWNAEIHFSLTDTPYDMVLVIVGFCGIVWILRDFVCFIMKGFRKVEPRNYKTVHVIMDEFGQYTDKQN